MSLNKKKLKTSFRVEKKIENIYTGGQVCISEDESFLVASCQDCMKIVNAKTGSVIATIEVVIL
jgi:U3 small nucleolar RNA-associated protein 13